MGENFKEPGGGKTRDVDKLAQNVRSWWGKTFVFIKKTNVKTWKRVFVLAFITGAIVSAAWIISLKIQTMSRAGTNTSLLLDPDTAVVTEGQTFNVDIVMNTDSSDVVAVKAVVNYNTQYFSLKSWDTTQSVFAANNPCQYNGKACEIINNDPASGKITIVVAKPSPGISTSSGVVGTLTFQAGQQIVTPTFPNITLNYTGPYTGAVNYDDSDVIADDKNGTDILKAVVNASITVQAPAGDSGAGGTDTGANTGTDTSTSTSTDTGSGTDNKQVEKDREYPRFDKMSFFFYKNRGDKVWWMARDNKGVSHYSYSFAGRKKQTRSTSFNIPPDAPRGPHFLIITASDQAGNTVSKVVLILVK